MTVTIPTSEAQYGYVVGRVIRALGDTTDADDKPDAVAAVGKVSFTPKAQLGRTTNYSAFIVREKIDAPLDAQGNLVRHEGATPAGIALTVGAYRVDFTLNNGSIPGFDIEVTAAHTEAAPLDLVTAAPYVPPSGVTVQTMLVPADAVVGQVLAWSASGLDWVDMVGGGGGAVSSVAGRTGAVVLSSADLTDVASLATDADLSAGLSGKANSTHTHAPEDITGTAVITTDPRLSDARTPTAHTHTLADVTGLQTALDGKAASGHTHAELHTHPAVIAQGATAADARAAIGAGTSSFSGAYADLSGKPTIPDTEAIQDVVGAMVAGAGGTYDDAGGSITLPAGGGGGSSTQVDIYYAVGAPGSQSSYTWTKPAGAKAVHVRMIQGGSGGGSGRRGAAGTVRCGGGGGGAGLIGTGVFPASDFGATETVKVGKGGAGGAAVTTDDTDGNAGGAGGVSAFGKLASWAGVGGGGGTATGGNAGGSSNVAWMSYYVALGGDSVGPLAGAASGSGGAGIDAVAFNQGHVPTAGGSGGGITSGNAASAGGRGGYHNWAASLAAGGTSGGGAGSPGQAVHGLGAGGGGGGSSITGAAGAGGDGGNYGGGGGGGGASLNGYASGAGGNGGDGIVIITTYF